MAIKTWNATALTGGASRALDAIPTSSLADGDRAVVMVSNVYYYMAFDSTATDAESSPDVVRPDDYDTGGVWKMQKAYGGTAADADIIGTVSQSAGVPTGDIIERGSNSNGDYAKFADGTMFCSLYTEVTDQAINTAYGSLYIGSRVWNFPVEFSETPTVTCGLARWGTGASWGGLSSVGTSFANIRIYDNEPRATGTVTRISVIAFGQWF